MINFPCLVDFTPVLGHNNVVVLDVLLGPGATEEIFGRLDCSLCCVIYTGEFDYKLPELSATVKVNPVLHLLPQPGHAVDGGEAHVVEEQPALLSDKLSQAWSRAIC